MGNILEIFQETIKKPNHKYPTTFYKLNYSIKKYSLKSTKYSVLYRETTLWNKKTESQLLFKQKIESKLLDITTEKMFFLNKAFINNFVYKKIICVRGLMIRRKLSAGPIL